jgi:PadR family transcriptional regulator PadR
MIDKSLITGSTTTLILKLLEAQNMYGYQMIEALAKKSDDTFRLKAGTLYPILHGLEKEGMVEAYEEKADGGKLRKYYKLTSKGRKLLAGKQQEWKEYTCAVNKVLNGGASFATT